MNVTLRVDKPNTNDERLPAGAPGSAAREDGRMDLGLPAQSCANAFREIGDRNGWRKGRNSSRGYDLLTLPHDGWDDQAHERYVLVLHHHLSSAAGQLDACGHSLSTGNPAAVITLARGVYVESSKVTWLLEDGVVWVQRAARAHLELLANFDDYVRLLPKRLDSGYPSFRRKQWKIYREQMRDGVIEKLFGKRGLSRKQDGTTLIGEALLTVSELEADFAELLTVRGPDMLGGAFVVAPDLLVDPLVAVDAHLETPLLVDALVVEQAVLVALDAWLRALDLWVRYNNWETRVVDQLGQRLPALLGPSV